jgi:hypothetical protein
LRNFDLIASGLDVAPLRHAIARQSGLWNRQTFRTTYEGTPHVGVDDIWLRFAPEETDFKGAISDTAPVWHPAAARLPQARKIVLDLMAFLGAYELGRLLITRVRPGGRILPHADTDGAYVTIPDMARYHVVLQGLPGSLFRCGTETVCMETGSVWWFDAAEEHEVVNNSEDDRIHMLVDLRLWP